jgi:hypothetical protein
MCIPCVIVSVSHLAGRVLVTCQSPTSLLQLVPDHASRFALLGSHPVRTNSRPVHRFTWFVYLVLQEGQTAGLDAEASSVQIVEDIEG